MDEDTGERQFMTARHTLKTEAELEAAAAKIPKVLSDRKKKKYKRSKKRDSVVTYEKVTNKGETYNVHPEPLTNPVLFNQQFDAADLAALHTKCTGKQFVEAVKMLPEFNFSTEEAWKQAKVKSRPSPCFVCGVTGCLRRQERWKGRVLHGRFPNIPLVKFQHDQTDTIPSCYFVRNSDPLAVKFEDARKDMIEIERQCGGQFRN